MPRKSRKDEILGAVQGKLGKGSSRLGREGSAYAVSGYVPTGLEALDHWVIGRGGLPGNRITELYGDEGAGKSSLGFHFLAAAQRAGGVAVLVETERKLEMERLELFGVDLDELVLIEPESIEEVVTGLEEVLGALPDKAGANVIVQDSLAASRLEKEQPGKRAALMSDKLPRIATLAGRKQCALVAINQIRDKIGVVFGDPTTTPGGHAPKFHSTLRLQLWRGAAVKQGTDAVGIHTTVKATKNNVAVPFRKAKLRLMFDHGWDDEWATMHLAKERGVISKSARATAVNLAKARKGLGFEL